MMQLATTGEGLKTILDLDKSALEDPRWRATALDKILISGFSLCLVIALLAVSLYVSYQSPIWHAWIALFFAFCIFLSRELIDLHLGASAYSLIFIMYLGAAAIMILVDVDILADFGIIFIYAIPLIALVLISHRLSYILRTLNVIPLILVLSDYLIDDYTKGVIPSFNYVYLHLFMFVFFNIILPYAMQQVIEEALQSTEIRKKAHQSVVARKNIYQVLFKLSRQPSLIVKHTDREIVDSNDALNRTLFGKSLTNLKDFIFYQDIECDKAYDITLINRNFLLWRKAIEQTDSHLYVLEEVTELKQVTQELTAITHKANRQQLEDPNTSLPSREALARYIEPLKVSDKAVFLICAKPEFSEHHSRSMKPEIFHAHQLKYSDYIQTQLQSSYVAKISRHNFAFVVYDQSIECIKARMEKIYSNINALQDDEEDEFNAISKFSFAKISGSKNDVRYLIDQTENKIMQAGLGEYLINYEPEVDDWKFSHLTLRANLERAIDRDELSVVLQPKVSGKGELNEFEALLRWNKNGEFIPPSEFIPLAEQSGMVGKITDWLVDHVCLFLSKQREQGGRIFPISINISALDLDRDNFVDSILQCLTRHNVPPALLGIELTETALLKNDENAIEQLRQLRSWGIRVSIDDFGVGQSSLSRIVEFPIDVLKLDRSFLFKLDQDNRRLILIQAMVNLCHNLGIQVVAEGVETQDELDKLTPFQPISFQGYYFAKPLSLKQVSSLFAEQDRSKPIIFPLV